MIFKIVRVVSDNNVTTFKTFIWVESNIFWYQKLRLFARKNNYKVQIVCKLTKSVRNYGDARNTNYVFFSGD